MSPKQSLLCGHLVTRDQSCHSSLYVPTSQSKHVTYNAPPSSPTPPLPSFPFSAKHPRLRCPFIAGCRKPSRLGCSKELNFLSSSVSWGLTADQFDLLPTKHIYTVNVGCFVTKCCTSAAFQKVFAFTCTLTIATPGALVSLSVKSYDSVSQIRLKDMSPLHFLIGNLGTKVLPPSSKMQEFTNLHSSPLVLPSMEGISRLSFFPQQPWLKHDFLTQN